MMNISALPEIFLAFMIVLTILVEAFISNKINTIVEKMFIFTIIGSFILKILIHYISKTSTSFNGMFIVDELTTGISLIILVLTLFIVLYSHQYLIDKKILKSEFYIIFLFAILGMLVMVSANNLLILYLGLELLSLSQYGLIAISRDNSISSEAAMKYFILSALSSGILLFGISYIYGMTGHLELNQIFLTLFNNSTANYSLTIFGLVFVTAGLIFKLGLVPFHMWVPDVYEGAILPVTNIIATITKITTIAFIIRFLISGLILLNNYWSQMLLFAGLFSLLWGNIAAIFQTNIKRLLGYSAIANMGFLILGLVTSSSTGVSSMLFYIISYSLTTIAGFGVLTFLSHHNYECEKIDDLKGLAKSHPFYAFMILVVMLSLAGMPPLLGFYAKLNILRVLVNLGYIKTTILTILMTAIGAYYYLRVIKVMYFDEKILDLTIISNTRFNKIILIINCGLIFTLSLMPGWLITFCQNLIMA